MKMTKQQLRLGLLAGSAGCLLGACVGALAMWRYSQRAAAQVVGAAVAQMQKEMEKIARDFQKEDEAPKVSYLITGSKTVQLGVNSSSLQAFNSSGDNQPWAPVEIDWRVTDEVFDAIKKGMTLADVRGVLGLAKLEYHHPGPRPRFELICLQTGSPEEFRRFVDSALGNPSAGQPGSPAHFRPERVPRRLEGSDSASIESARERFRMPVKAKVLLIFEGSPQLILAGKGIQVMY